MRKAHLLIATALIFACACPVFAKAMIQKINYKGWENSYELSNPLVKLVVVPEIGGRIMEYSINGENVIWQNPKELGNVDHGHIGKAWHNYGGYKAWNAPQAKWRFPDNDNFYDFAPASAEIIESPEPGMIGIRISCRPIKHLGFQFVREIYLSETTSRVRIVETMKNVSDSEIEWSPWEVTQVNAPCWIAFPVDNSKFPLGWAIQAPEGKDMKQTTRIGNIGILEYKNAVDKVGIDSLGGWMAYLKGTLGYVKQWSVHTSRSDYPDDGCNAEVFTAAKAFLGYGGYVEMEVLGPVVKLKPGEQTQLIEDWFLTKVNQSASSTSDMIERLKLLQKRGLLPRSVKF